MNTSFAYDVGVIGGAGHVGLPLALTFADCGLKTVIVDIAADKVEQVRRGEMPFFEEGGEEVLRRVLKRGTLTGSDNPAPLRECRFLVCVIGTPVDQHLNPSFAAIHRMLEGYADCFRDGQILILRSTVVPGISEHVQRLLHSKGLDISVAFCPERVAQGHSLREFRELPQIISAFNTSTLDAVRELFRPFVSEFVEMQPGEAELSKLIINAWRYMQFAAVNQFYMIATEMGFDFERILHGCRHNYPRSAGMPNPGFAAGPCLVKDTMQLAAFCQNGFMLGHVAMLINEGLPAHLIKMAKRQIDLSRCTAGILGMAFKAESDDPRDSLSYKLRKLLQIEAQRVVCTDPYIQDSDFLPLTEVVKESDVLFVATPHKAYRQLTIPSNKLVLDVWNCLPESDAGVLARLPKAA